MSEDTGTAAVNGEQKAEETQQGKSTTEQATNKGAVPYSRFAEVVEQRKGLETTLAEIVEGIINDLPEGVRDLVPNLPAAEKVAWIKVAKERGLFAKGSSQGDPKTDSPDSKRPGGKQQVDLNGMSATEKLRFGFSQRK